MGRFIPACVGNSLAQSGDAYRSFGFIPACVGNSHVNCLTDDSNTVHPRVCGELVFQPYLPMCVTVHPRVCGELFHEQER